MARKNKRATKTDATTTKPIKTLTKVTDLTESHSLFWHSEFWKKNWWKALIIFCLPFILYYQANSFGYVLDDTIVIEDNSFTKQGFSGIDDLLTTESMTGYFGEQKNLVEGNRYRPLSLITFAIEHQVAGGKSPGPSHFINILLYALTGILLYRLFSMLIKDNKTDFWWLATPFLASLLYIAHPIHIEAVANIKGRDEILALLLSLSTLYTTLRYVDSKKTFWMISSAVLFFLALLSKENSITFLAVIPLTIYFFSQHKFKTILKTFLPLLISTILYLILRFSVAGVPEFGKEVNDLMNNPFLGMKGGEKMATIMFTLYKYLQLYILPHPLNHDYYPYAIPVLGWADYRSIGSLLLHMVMIGIGLYGFRRKKIYSYAILYYFITLSIVSNIVINLGTFMNERFLYMASVGLSLLVAYILSEKLGNWKGKTGAIIASVITAFLLIGYGLKTIERVPDWSSALSLNQSAVKNGSNSARANSFMATAMYEDSKSMSGENKKQFLQEAMSYSDKALNIFNKYQNANLMKAGIAAELYKIDRDEHKLLGHFAEVMSSRPDVPYINTYLDYLEGRTSDVDYLIDWYVNTSLNEVMTTAQQPKWALHYLNRAYKLDNHHKGVLAATAKVYRRLGDDTRADNFEKLANLEQ
ncbi:MAG: glycosyltransferase family 39 protein [Saprospiraceae bacterium]